MILRLVTNDGKFPSKAAEVAAQVRALADMIDDGLDVEHGVVVGVVDGKISYAPLGTISLIEATGLLELASRKVERDLREA